MLLILEPIISCNVYLGGNNNAPSQRKQEQAQERKSNR